MTLKKIEDRPTPRCVYNVRLYLIASVASIAAVMIGYDSAFIGGTLALGSFKKEFDFGSMTKSETDLISANIVSCYQAGCFFGALLGYVVGQQLGRKWGLLASSMLFTVGAGMMLGANGDRGLGLIYGGRVIAGLAIGAASNLTPILISEISPPAIRGQLVGLYELGWQFGGLVGFWINYGVNTTMEPSHRQWLIPFAVQLIPGGMLAAGSFYIKESPRWLLSKGRREEALSNLCWIRKLQPTDQYMIEEIAMIDAQIAHEQAHGTGFWVPFKLVFGTKRILKRVLLGGSMFLFQNGTGINAINYYSPRVFQSMGITGTNVGLLSTGIFGVIKTVMAFVWLGWMIDNLGRRMILMIGAAGGAVAIFYVGGYIAIANPQPSADADITPGGISAMCFFYIWTVFYAATWNGTPWVIGAEIFPQNVRTLTQALMAANNWFWNFLIARFTPHMFTDMGYGVYIFFGCMMIIAVVFVFFFLPETKGIPMEEMDRLFDGGLKPWKAHGIVWPEIQRERAAMHHNFDLGSKGASSDKLDVEQNEKVSV